ncbi:hypothetical protein AGMMS49975_06740 [Clostridia bacterium]|nr:hypothetical protein AGMMS49975_06740 [Clostridia bacterium]
MTIGNKIIRYDSIDSTNDEIKRLARLSPLEHGTVVTAGEQTAGRGRLGRTWLSPRGGLYFSVYLAPNEIYPDFAGHIAMFVGVSVAASLGVPCHLKWTNDVVIKHNGIKKVSGLLSETVFEGDTPLFTVIGIGVNVKSLRENYISLEDVGVNLTPDALLPRILSEMDKNYPRLGSPEIRARYKELCVNLGEYAKITSHGRELEGICTDITHGGHMLLQTQDGITEVFAGEATLRGANGRYS